MDKIILTGPKHCGKSTAGELLASIISGSFIDLDTEITQKTGKTPRELYKENPAVFQKAEAEALTSLAGVDCDRKRIIATGGGIIDNPDAVTHLSLLKNSGVKIVYLNISAAAAWERITAGSKELPPFLQTNTPQETHHALHERRATAYLKFADIVIDVEGKTPSAIASEIASVIYY
ncbi:MAG: shikimate kinase [Treponema sp.]|nr:shikimate kinase [Treponema sp.]